MQERNKNKQFVIKLSYKREDFSAVKIYFKIVDKV